MANKIFQILRNSTVYNDYTTAAAAFNVPADVTGLIDGQLKSARYVDGNEEKAIIGIWNSTTKKWSMIDIKSNLNNAISAAAQDASTKANAAKEAAISASDVTLVHDDGTLIYTLYQGTDDNKSEIGKIDIPKDMVVESGSVITATNDDINNDSTVVVGEKYIKLVVTNVAKPLYIAVNALYKDHTAAKDAREVQVAISDDNVISATIVNVDASKVTLKDSESTNLQDALGTINSTLNNKQDVIDDLSTIRSKATTAYQKPAGGIPATDLANDIIPSFTIVDDHSGAGSDPNKIYIPSAKSEKETYDGLIDDEEVLSKAVNIINKKLIDHINNSFLHKTFEDHELIESANENIDVLQKHIFNGHEYADLNLPSGTLWATKNIGAESTFDVGSYFMWGDAKQRIDKSEFVVTDCLYTIDGTTFSDKYKSITSPNPNRPIGICLDVNDDPANATWHDMWRVPTFAQIEELFTKNHIQHFSDALGNWIRIEYLIQLPISSYYVDNTEVQDMNTIYMMYRDIEGTDAMKIAKIELTGTDVDVTAVVSKESVPIWTGVIIRPVLN